MKPIHVFGIFAAVGMALVGVVIYASTRSPRDLLPGGKADKRRPEEFDANELQVGTLIEMEHSKDWRIAREIAMDHLADHGPGYYVNLCRLYDEPPCRRLRTAA